MSVRVLPDSRSRVSVGLHDVPKNADTVDLDFDYVSILHINRRVSTVANSARRSCCDDVAGG
jgi:hypothetical protein